MDIINNILEIKGFNEHILGEIERKILNKEDNVDFSMLINIPKGIAEYKEIEKIEEIFRIIYRKKITYHIRDHAEAKRILKNYCFIEEDLSEELLNIFISRYLDYKQYKGHNERMFALSNWGTYNAIPFENKKRTKNKGFYFKTGWGIPTGWIEKLSEEFPDQEFYLYSKKEFTKGAQTLYVLKNSQVISFKKLNKTVRF